jgi:hypothetical protein
MNSFFKLISVLTISSLLGCSVYKAATQPGPAEISDIGVGMPRQMLISKIGAPKMIDSDKNGHKQDIFEFQSGLNQASKVRVVLYLAADVFTLTLAELILWPIELTMLDSATCTGIATYDANFKIENWIVTNKNNSAQDC